jgi:outer membrane protein assembly factor BamB
VSNDLVFAADRQDSLVHAFRALDRRTGNVRWEHGGWQDPVEIVAADERYVVVATGEIRSQRYGQVTFVVLDARTGKEQSRFDAGHPENFMFSEVALRNHRLVYAQRRSLVARKVPQGTQDWVRKIDDDPGAVTMARSTDNKTAFALTSGTVLRVVAVDTTTGRERWTKTGVSLRDAGNSIAALSPVTTAPTETLRGTDSASGTSRWHYDVPSDLSSYRYPDLKVGDAGGRIAISTGCNPG